MSETTSKEERLFSASFEEATYYAIHDGSDVLRGALSDLANIYFNFVVRRRTRLRYMYWSVGCGGSAGESAITYAVVVEHVHEVRHEWPRDACPEPSNCALRHR